VGGGGWREKLGVGTRAFGLAATTDAAAAVECLGLASREPVDEGDWEDWEVEADVEEDAERLVVVDAERVEDEEDDDECADELEETDEERAMKPGRSRVEGEGLGVAVDGEEEEEEGIEEVVDGVGRDDRDGMTAGGSISPELGFRTEEEAFLDEGEANAPIPNPLRTTNGESRSIPSFFSLPPAFATSSLSILALRAVAIGVSLDPPTVSSSASWMRYRLGVLATPPSARSCSSASRLLSLASGSEEVSSIGGCWVDDEERREGF
jgi:hypothetical protein